MHNLTKITILGREITVKKCTSKELEMISKDKDSLGFFDGESIYISRAVGEARFRRILLHEAAHAILEITGASNLLEADEEEVICTSFESLYELFQNKAVNKFLSE